MTEPAANLLRLSAVAEWAALPERTVRDFAADGRLGGAALWPGGRRYFLREVVRTVLFGAPLSPCPFGAEPVPELLRVFDVLEWTGLREPQFRWAERHGVAGGQTLHPNAKRLYPKHQIRAVFFAPLLPAAWPPVASHSSALPIVVTHPTIQNVRLV
jgi:hypothetical protein